MCGRGWEAVVRRGRLWVFSRVLRHDVLVHFGPIFAVRVWGAYAAAFLYFSVNMRMLTTSQNHCECVQYERMSKLVVKKKWCTFSCTDGGVCAGSDLEFTSTICRCVLDSLRTLLVQLIRDKQLSVALLCTYCGFAPYCTSC